MTELEKLLKQKKELEKQIKELQKQKTEIGHVGYEYKKLSGRTDNLLFHTIYLNRVTSDALLNETSSCFTLSGRERKQTKIIKVSLVIEKTKEELISSLETIIAELNQLLNEIKTKNITEDDGKKSANGAGNT